MLVPEAQKGTPESSSVSVPKTLNNVPKSVSEPVHVSPGPILLTVTLPASTVMAPEFILNSFPNQEFIPKIVSDTKGCFKPQLFGVSPSSQEDH